MDISDNPFDLLKTGAMAVLGILLVILIMIRAEPVALIAILVAIIVLFASQQTGKGTLTRAREKRANAVNLNAQPSLNRLIRSSSEVGAGQAVVVGKISGLVRIADTPRGKRELLYATSKTGKTTGTNPVTPISKADDALYEITTADGFGPAKKQTLFLIRRSDLLLPDVLTTLQGDLTVRCSGFVPSGLHLVPDTWSQKENHDIGYAITRSYVSDLVAEDVLEDMTAVVDKAKKGDPNHVKKLEEIDRGVSNPGQ